MQSKFKQYQDVCKTINENRKLQINIYEALTRNLQLNNSHSQNTIIEHSKTILSKSDLIHKCELESSNKELKLCSLEKTLNSTQIQLSHSNEAIVNITSLNRLLKSELSDQKTKVEEQILAIDELTKLLNTEQIKVRELKQVNGIQQAELTDSRIRIGALQATAIQSTATIEALNQQIIELKSQLDSRNENIKNLNAIVEGYSSCCKASSCVSFGASNNVHVVKVDGVDEPFEVLCNSQLAGNGWTVIQRRINGELDFYRNWNDYKKGFGSPSGEFFIGLERLYHMTKDTPHQMYIWLEDFNNIAKYASFDDFKVASEQQAYALLSLGKHKGTTRNAMRVNTGQKFTTYDRDNDADEINNCAERLHGAWWYDHCGFRYANTIV